MIDNIRVYRPKLWVPSLCYIDFAQLKDFGITHWILDVDNVVTDCWSDKVDREIQTYLLGQVREGFITDFCLLSNTGLPNFLGGKRYKNRVAKIAAQLNTGKYHCATWPLLKPRPEPFAMAVMQLEGAVTGSKTNVGMIGDLLPSDIVGANRLGLFSICVNPLGPDRFLTRRKRKQHNLIAEELEEHDLIVKSWDGFI